MSFMPKRVKFRKQQRGKMKGNATRGNYVAYGDYGLQSLQTHWLVFPDKPISKKPLETRMGTGKAPVDYWAACIKPGTLIYEIAGVPEELAKQAFARIAHKMPVKCRFVGRRIAV